MYIIQLSFLEDDLPISTPDLLFFPSFIMEEESGLHVLLGNHDILQMKTKNVRNVHLKYVIGEDK